MEIRTPVVHTSPTMAETAARLADQLTREIASVIADRGHCVLAVAGGKTPVPLFHALRERSIAWDDVTVTLSDERFVPVEHTDSNEAMIRRELLVGAAAKARLVPLYHPARTAEAALPLIDLPQPIDILVVGMGEDMHTLSWFPDADGLPGALLTTHRRRLAVVKPEGMTPRITLTAGAAGEARFIHLLISGLAKKQALDKALATPRIVEAPVRRLFAYQNPAVDVHVAELS
jgi:6-phosphogluconolactonase